MSRFCWSLILLVAVVSAGCSGSEEASPVAGPRETVREMLVLAEAGEWGEYIDRYYGEAGKITSEQERTALVRRFQVKWGPEVVEALRDASTVEPVILDENRAEFRVGGETVFELYRGDDGRWGFHL